MLVISTLKSISTDVKKKKRTYPVQETNISPRLFSNKDPVSVFSMQAVE